MDRAQTSEATFAEAKALADAHGFRLTNPSDGCYQLRFMDEWIINLYPRRKGGSPRMYHDKHKPGPFLKLPQDWTILDAVQAAIAHLETENRK